MQPPNTIVCFMCKGFVSYKDNNPSKFNKHMNSEHMAFFGLEYLLAGCSMSEDERFAVRDVIKDRIEPSDTVVSKDATLEEDSIGDENEKKNTTSRHPCPHCNVSYTFKVDLTSHIESKHTKSSTNSDRDLISKSKTLVIGKKCGPNLGQKLSKEEAWKMATETRRKDLTSTSKAADITRKDNKKDTASPIKKVIAKTIESPRDGMELDTEEPAPLNVLKKKILLAKSSSKVTPDKKILVDKSNTPSKVVAAESEDPGSGTVCPACNKEFKLNTHMRLHFKDIHQPGHFPCTGENCGKVFTSKNKMSSHRSRHCNPNKAQRRTL